MTTQKIVPYAGNENYIFVSYSHKDSPKVHEFIKTLITAGYNIWYDEGIDPGMEWDDEIAAHIEKCDSLIAFISNNYLASENCKDELNFARDLQKERLLIYMEKVELPRGMAMRLNRMQAIHMYTYQDENAFFEKVYNTSMIKRAKSKDIVPPPLSIPPHTPLNADVNPVHITTARYQLKECIQKGGLATVYRAFDTMEKREVAVKFFEKNMVNDCPFLSDEKLFDTIMNINSPHLSALYDRGCVNTPYIVTEYIDGNTLRQYIDKRPFFSEDTLRNLLILFRQILGALNSLHIHDIFYGDVTPYNIMISKTGTAYLVDYTECNYNGTPAPNKTMILTEYMSPERSGFGIMDYRSDIYEAGVILEQLVFKSINGARLTKPQSGNAYNTQIFDIIKKATNPEPNDRYQSVVEMLQDIDKLCI